MLKLKKLGVLFCLALALCGAVYLPNQIAYADSTNPKFEYGQELASQTRVFYDALETMKTNGIFLKGEDYLVENKVVSTLVSEYSQGSKEINECFNDALKAFEFDNPELFYIDYNNISLTITNDAKGYKVYIGSGRNESYIFQGFGGALQDRVDEFNSSLTTLTNAITGICDSEKVRSLNSLLVRDIQISSCLLEKDNNVLGTAYSALIDGKATSQGVAKLCKCALDVLDVENSIVEGYCVGKEGYAPSMWNIVNCDGWVGIDISQNIQSLDKEECLFVDSIGMEKLHVAGKGVFSEGSVIYPQLVTYYEQSTNGKLTIKKEELKQNVSYSISYLGLGENKLEGLGYYLAMREGNSNQDNLGEWMSLKFLALTTDNCQIYDEKTVINGLATEKTYEFAIFSVQPDSGQKDAESGLFSGFSNLDVGDVVASNVNLENLNCENDYVYHPVVTALTSDGGFLQNKKQTITVTFDKKLMQVGGVVDSPNIEITVLCDDKRISDDELQSFTKIENVQFLYPNGLSFDFTPSPLLKHNNIQYCFEVNNVVGRDELNSTEKSLLPIYITFKQPISFGNIFSENEIELLDGNLDLSEWEFEDEMLKDNAKTFILLMNQIQDKEGLMKDKVEEFFGKVLCSKGYKLSFLVDGKNVQGTNNQKFDLKFDYFEDLNSKSNKQIFLYQFDNDADFASLRKEDIKVYPCFKTSNGIVTTVNQLGDCLIAVCEKETSEKILHVDFDGVGGDVSLYAVQGLSENCLLELSPKTGYKIDFVLLNGEVEEIIDNKIELKFNGLEKENIVVVRFSQLNSKYSNNTEINYFKNCEKYTETKDGENIESIILFIIFLGLAVFGFVIFRKSNGKNN